MAWTLCTSGAAIIKGGANVNSTIKASGSTLASWSDESEAIIANTARSDVVTNYASLTANGKQILGNLASSLVAQKMIHYDMSGFTSRAEAQTMLDILENDIRRGLKLIEDDKQKTYLGIT